jgi:hypothetical protein
MAPYDICKQKRESRAAITPIRPCTFPRPAAWHCTPSGSLVALPFTLSLVSLFLFSFPSMAAAACRCISIVRVGGHWCWYMQCMHAGRESSWHYSSRESHCPSHQHYYCCSTWHHAVRFRASGCFGYVFVSACVCFRADLNAEKPPQFCHRKE